MKEMLRLNLGLVVSAAFALLAISLLAVTIAFRAADQRQLEKVARSTHDALCTFKGDLEQRYQGGRQFLIDHPEGIPGISPADIERSLANQKSTLHALSALDC